MMPVPFLRVAIGLLFLLHGLAAAALALGVLLLLIWAIKFMPGPKLKRLGLWLFGIGVIGAVLFMGASFTMMSVGGPRFMMDRDWQRGGPMMKQWIEDDEDALKAATSSFASSAMKK